MKYRLIIMIGLAGVFCDPAVYAGKVELSTYYPAPYGEYSQLKSTGNDTSNDTYSLQAQGSSGTGLVVTNANRVGIGTAGPIGILELSTTTEAFYPPRVTTAQRDSIASPLASEPTKEGAVVYNKDTGHDTLEVYNGSAWSGVGGGSGGAFGSWAVMNVNAVYRAASDGFVVATMSQTFPSRSYLIGYTDGSSNPSTFRAIAYVADPNGDMYNYSSPPLQATFLMPVRKNDYWKVAFTDTSWYPGHAHPTVYWLPMGN